MDKQKYWERRSNKYQDDIRGVLFKKPYPNIVNVWFHKWTTSIVVSAIKKNSAKSFLDIGCGYGRLSSELVDEFVKTKFDGVDISKTYVELYNKSLKGRGKAFVADMCKLPFEKEKYDMVVVVATLMYLINQSDQKKAIKEIARVVKKGGTVLLIERTPLMQIFDLKTLLRKGGFTKQISFTKTQVQNLIAKNNMHIVSTHSWPSKVIPFFTAYEIILQ